ncbi:hypothetical protein KOR34_45400 [Posidoniimonas corsicana]|uniref:Uncharacterized protein n=1 Tax=Posidoniimonas corsicana TaxID=1938618 RepID=A0A5C5UXT6_9BACT|nr:hypothetical protein [Posidoniimonas corsicana]TWT31164.1 hypothetical protein KOR34_45400 [Posidoniimonas corsicana]
MNNSTEDYTDPKVLDAAVEELSQLVRTEHWFCSLPEYFRRDDPRGAGSIAWEHAHDNRPAPPLTGDARYEYLDAVCRLLATFDPVVVETYYERRAAG